MIEISLGRRKSKLNSSSNVDHYATRRLHNSKIIYTGRLNVTDLHKFFIYSGVQKK